MKHTDCGIDPPLMMDQKHLSSTYIIFSFGMLSKPFLYVPLVTSPKSQKQRKNVTSIIPLVILFQKFASIVTSLHRRLVNTEVIYIQQRCYCCSTLAIPGIQEQLHITSVLSNFLPQFPLKVNLAVYCDWRQRKIPASLWQMTYNKHIYAKYISINKNMHTYVIIIVGHFKYGAP